MELNRNFPKEEIGMTKKYIFKCLTSLATEGMQINMTLGFHLTPLRMSCICTYVQFSNNEHRNQWTIKNARHCAFVPFPSVSG